MKSFHFQLGLKISTEAVLVGAIACSISGIVHAQAVAQVTPAANTVPNLLDPNFKPITRPAPTNSVTPAGDSIPAPVQAAYIEGAYSTAAKLGAAALVTQTNNANLRLLVANSLSWSGRLDAAVEQYEKLMNSPQAAAAKVGQANILRWRGKAEQAELLYNSVLKADPNNADAKEGKRLADRELRPNWYKSIGFGKDSSNFRRLESATSYRAYTQDRSLRWGAGYVVGKDLGASAADKYAQINANVQWLNVGLRPKIDVSIADGFNKTRLYGLVSLDPLPDRLSLRAGYINWGRQAFNSAAQAAHLAAQQVGLTGQWMSPLGEIRVRGDYYAVADNNRLWDAEVIVNPAWQPLPANIRWYTGMYNKQARRVDSRYWSPVAPYTLGLLGLKKAWYFDNADVSLGVQGGLKASDEAKNNFGISANAKYWVSGDTALGLDFWSSNSPRQVDYKQHLLTINLQRLW